MHFSKGTTNKGQAIRGLPMSSTEKLKQIHETQELLMTLEEYTPEFLKVRGHLISQVRSLDLKESDYIKVVINRGVYNDLIEIKVTSNFNYLNSGDSHEGDEQYGCLCLHVTDVHPDDLEKLEITRGGTLVDDDVYDIRVDPNKSLIGIFVNNVSLFRQANDVLDIQSDKQAVKAIKSRLMELKHDVPLGHCYEILAKLNGYETRNHAPKGFIKSKITMSKEEREVVIEVLAKLEADTIRDSSIEEVVIYGIKGLNSCTDEDLEEALKIRELTIEECISRLSKEETLKRVRPGMDFDKDIANATRKSDNKRFETLFLSDGNLWCCSINGDWNSKEESEDFYIGKEEDFIPDYAE